MWQIIEPIRRRFEEKKTALFGQEESALLPKRSKSVHESGRYGN